jgi:hypothetical protein
MPGSMKDALTRSGLAAPEETAEKPKTGKKKPDWAEPLSDDESLPPLFDAPALTKPVESKPSTKPKT